MNEIRPALKPLSSQQQAVVRVEVSLLGPSFGAQPIEVLPELYPGQKFAYRGQRFKITQLCGETVYVKLSACDWDAPVPRDRVLAAVMSHSGNGHGPQPAVPANP